MQKKNIKKKVEKEHKGAKRSIRGFLRKGDQEKLHQFRVGIKKLRAVATLIEETAGACHLRKDLKQVKETYQLSGKVRDSYLHMELAKKVSAPANYLSDENNTLKKAARKLRKNRPHHLKMLRRSKEKMLKHVRGAKDKQVDRFYKSELQTIASCLTESNGVEELHGCRKRLKVLFYNLPLVGGALKVPINEAYLQQVQTAIGNWHDNVVAAEQFPQLSEKSQGLFEEVKQLGESFYERATTKAKELTKKTG
jgi:CHAD domain-containing protein